jgi:hypothetical protein
MALRAARTEEGRIEHRIALHCCSKSSERLGSRRPHPDPSQHSGKIELCIAMSARGGLLKKVRPAECWSLPPQKVLASSVARRLAGIDSHL